MSDSSAIDVAVMQKLNSDTELLALMPNGVYLDEAPAKSKQFVIVHLVDAHDVPGFGERAIEEVIYLIKAVEMLPPTGPAVQNSRAAAARIDALLDDGDLTIAGYHLMIVRRESRVRYLEVDELDASIRWSHRGGHYQVMVAPTT